MVGAFVGKATFGVLVGEEVVGDDMGDLEGKAVPFNTSPGPNGRRVGSPPGEGRGLPC